MYWYEMKYQMLWQKVSGRQQRVEEKTKNFCSIASRADVRYGREVGKIMRAHAKSIMSGHLNIHFLGHEILSTRPKPKKSSILILGER